MANRFVKGVATGAIIGTAASMLIFPQMDRSTRSRLRKSGRIVKDVAEDVVDGVKHWSK